ncbi:unnamed protein product [Prorocentrum cordatum]|uniref:Gem-associated protein 5 TPR domain-containing protein n=1 Tax=Prorocentrum cordatum TaxID=2364126 RepID=A0ABN9TCM7_9DINO|nr:unnamed protein product [Polarella glacialis]
MADRWVEEELAHKAELAQKAGPEERAQALHRARLLRLWATDAQEALAPGADGEADGSLGGDLGLSEAWLWAALSAGHSREAWESAAAGLLGSGGQCSAVDGVHHAAALALVLDRLEDAVRLYLRAELFADALLLARLRLPAGHPLVAHVYGQWAADLRRRSRHDQAAVCHLAIGNLGEALADLEESFPPARPSQVGPDPVRLAMSFAAACVAEAIATALLDTPGSKAAVMDSRGECETGGFDAALAYNHRSWWGQKELRVAVQAWRRCVCEALHAGQLQKALELAKVAVAGRAPTAGERFLQAALQGYASAAAWWAALLGAEADAPAEGAGGGEAQEEAATPLARFVAANQDAVVPDGDWDFEWRALTWLPAFEHGEDPLLSAAVELGRACTALASGLTREAAASEECTASAAELAAAASPPGQEPWPVLSRVFAGLPLRAGGGAEVLRRGYRAALVAEAGRAPSAALGSLARAAALGRAVPLVEDAEAAALELLAEVARAIQGCGLWLGDEEAAARPEPAPCPLLSAEGASWLVGGLEHLQRHSLSPLVVPIAVAAWCSRRFRCGPRVPAEAEPPPEYEEVGEEPTGPQWTAAAQAMRWQPLLLALSTFAAGAEGAGEPSPGGALGEALQGVAGLEALRCPAPGPAAAAPLSWAARLSLARRAAEQGAFAGDEAGSAAAVCELLAAVPPSVGPET